MSTKRGQKSGLEGAASNGKAPAPSPANAWARPLKTGPPPGMGPADKAKAPTPAKTPSNGALAIHHIHRERLLHLSLTLIGQKVVITLKNGHVLEGIFHNFTPFRELAADMKNKYVLNAVKTVQPPSSGDNGIRDGSTAVIQVDNVLYIHAKNINLDRPVANGGGYTPPGKLKGDIITDTQISGSRSGRKGELVAAGSAWTAGGGGNSRAEALAGTLDDKDKGGITRKAFGTAVPKGSEQQGLQGSIGKWDQFKANQELFNVNASFDENLYTTELDKSQIDAEKIAHAERLAREIESTTSSNMHIAEERGHAVETDYDEEDRYSGVLTKEGKQRHEANQTADKPDKPTVKIPTPAPAPKKMNYAAAAAKADASKKAAPPGFVPPKAPPSVSTPEPQPTEKIAKVTPDEKEKEPEPEVPKPTEEPKAVEAEATNDEKEPEVKVSEEPKVAEKTSANDIDAKKDETPKEAEVKKEDGELKVQEKPKECEPKEIKKTSKLNANAKEFTFNPAAKSFTPSFGGGAASFNPPQQQHQPQHMDPSMQMHAGHPMQHPHYMHPPMGQPGMMHMMNPQFGMRYPLQYGGMEQHIPQMHPQQPLHHQGAGAPTQAPGTSVPGGAHSGATSPVVPGEEESLTQQQDGEPSQPVVPQQQQHHQPPMHMPYGVPPQGAYFPGGAMAMPPRGPGYPPQFVGGPQQVPVGPGGVPYRQMYPMQPGMPPNMMRGPSGAPYYPGPNAGPIYPPGAYAGHGMMDENDPNFRGGRGGRGPGRGRGRRGGRGRGGPSGRGGYQQPYSAPSSGQSSGRNTPQQQTPTGDLSMAEGAQQEGDTKAQTSNVETPAS